MDMSERLSLLFAQDLSLLEKNTGLRVSNETSNSAKGYQAGRETPAEGNCTGRPALNMAGPVSNNSTLADQKRPRTKEEDGSLSQYAMFDTGVQPPPALIAHAFCPAMAIAKLPYKYMRGEKSQAIGRCFFDQGQFWQREWDLYYIFPPPDVSSRAILLLSAVQVQQFLNELNQAFQTNLSLPIDPELGLLIPFEEDGTPSPQYLGQSCSRDIKDQLVAKIPESLNEDSGSTETVCGTSQDQSESAKAFRAKMEAGYDASKNKSKATREKKRNEKIDRHREWTQSLRRAQCYMGLHPRRFSQAGGTNISEAKNQPEIPVTLPMLQLTQPAPFPFAYDPIFVCIDIESNERRHREITEIGISTLDTLDLVNVPPGKGGENWIRWVRSRHIRIKESAHIINHTYVTGCPNRFEFGESEFISFRDVSKAVEGCFSPPYSAQVPVKFVEQAPNGEKAKVTIETAIKEYKLRPRNIVLVGHGIQGDIDYLRILGCNIFADRDGSHPSRSFQRLPHDNFQAPPPRLIDCFDTANMFQVLKRDTHHRALDTILNSLGIIGWNLHNAGNDARYTLGAMVRIILNSRLALGGTPRNSDGDFLDWGMASSTVGREQTTADDPVESRSPHKVAWDAEVERRVAETVADSETRVRDECKIWEIVTGWDSDYPPTVDDFDGGEPKGVIFQRQKQKQFK
ncbi:hypothetical protein PISL3812_02895 [Talaromyces islandicus]|uniref:Gfd2/YDR514C-like C-terminal domain-containing protein n=1 Tax=Talaromyces islandicus TaxID=28573 RepID=A0A0U1LRX2_TALIS|nr:hypothetical protein PISL3812_02895 [Talaromyces islandicus]